MTLDQFLNEIKYNKHSKRNKNTIVKLEGNIDLPVLQKLIKPISDNINILLKDHNIEAKFINIELKEL